MSAKQIKEHQSSPSDVCLGFAMNTPIHGVKQILSSNIALRILYLCVVAAAATVSLACVILTFQDFHDDPTFTSLRTETRMSQPFPKVSICNLNPVRASMYNRHQSVMTRTATMPTTSVTSDSTKSISTTSMTSERTSETTDGGSSVLTQSHSTGRRRRSQSLTPKQTSDGHSLRHIKPQMRPSQLNKHRSRRQADQNIQHMRLQFYKNDYTRFTDSQKKEYGHQLNTMLLSCVFNGLMCSSQDFDWFHDPLLGNCYSFRPPPGTGEVYSSGSHAGLSIRLDVEESEYMGALTDSAGFKVVVGSRSSPVLPTNQGMTITPGLDTYFGVSTVHEEVRHDSCKDFSPSENLRVNLYTQLQNVSYSKAACIVSCLQLHLIKQCSCCDYRYPCPSGLDVCKEEDNCSRELLEKVSEELDCSTKCKDKCSDFSYTSSYSTGKWHKVVVGPAPQFRMFTRSTMGPNVGKTLTSSPLMTSPSVKAVTFLARTSTSLSMTPASSTSGNRNSGLTSAPTSTSSSAKHAEETTSFVKAETTPISEALEVTSEHGEIVTTPISKSESVFTTFTPFGESMTTQFGEEQALTFGEQGPIVFGEDGPLRTPYNEEGPITISFTKPITPSSGQRELIATISNPMKTPYEAEFTNLPSILAKRSLESRMKRSVANFQTYLPSVTTAQTPPTNTGHVFSSKRLSNAPTTSVFSSGNDDKARRRKRQVGINETSAVTGLHVYFSSLDTHVVTQRSLYTWHRSLSALGGHLALWLGVSVLALVHFLLSLFQLVIAGVKKLGHCSGSDNKVESCA